MNNKFAILIAGLMFLIFLLDFSGRGEQKNKKNQVRISDSINYVKAKNAIDKGIWVFKSKFYSVELPQYGYSASIKYSIVRNGDSCYVEIPMNGTRRGRPLLGNWGKVIRVSTLTDKKGTIVHEMVVATKIQDHFLTIRLPKRSNYASVDISGREHFTGNITNIEDSENALEVLNP
jgi:hypothetical protein